MTPEFRDLTNKEAERRVPLPVGELPESVTAIVRSTRALLNHEIDEAGFLAYESQGRSLQQDGSHFIAACYWHLVQLGCPGNACDLVLFVTGLTGGDANKMIQLTDPQIAEGMAISKRQVMRKRKELKEWMLKERYAVLVIEEGEYDHKNKKNAPTRYRSLVAPEGAKIVLLARTGKLWRDGDERAQAKAIKEAAEETVWENLDAPVPVKERKKKNVKTSAKISETAQKVIKTNFTKFLRAEFQQKHDLYAAASKLVSELQEILNEESVSLTVSGGILGMSRPQKE